MYGITGESGCLLCEIGKYSPKQGLVRCLDAPKGSFVSSIGDTGYEMCPPASFTADDGTFKCTECPPGRITPGTGATNILDCVNPNWNFIQGFIASFAILLFSWQYLFRARFGE
jgi:hypothetical protein